MCIFGNETTDVQAVNIGGLTEINSACITGIQLFEMGLKMDLSVVIVTYNVRDLLRDCLLSLRASLDYAGLKSETYVIDNGTDGSCDMVQEEFPWVKCIPNPENNGFSRSNNLALKHTKGKYILLLNPDTKLEENTLQVMCDFMNSHPDLGAATPRVNLPDGKLDGACHRAFPTPWNSLCRFTHLSRRFPESRIFNGYNLGYLDINTTHEIDCCSGAFMFIRRSAILGDGKHPKVGFLDEDYWANGEDIDWCYRFKSAGWKIIFLPSTSIIHYKGASSGTQVSSQNITKADEQVKAKWINAFYDAMPIFYKKHYSQKYPFYLKWLVMLGVEIKRRIALRKLLNT